MIKHKIKFVGIVEIYMFLGDVIRRGDNSSNDE
jgi:hypothetical protein